ncbi:hypothetical protein DL768_008062 [Monosporascus sp. mg162]|nr:hypothetical protein DL768_008062 [Monosporascus sp. mg162]
MRLTTAFFTILVTAGSAAAAGESAKIQYYYDGGCSNYAVEFNVPGSTCYNYDWSNSNSGNVAGCNSRYNDCTCRFYENSDCKGTGKTAQNDGPFGNCASNWGKGFKSVRCTIY